jgi:hypothetical protein
MPLGAPTVRLPSCRRLIIKDDPEAASQYTADYIIGAADPQLPCACINPANRSTKERINAFDPTPDKPFVLGLPTGSSPVLIYHRLVQRHKAGDISFRNVVTFNMVQSESPLHLATASPLRRRVTVLHRNMALGRELTLSRTSMWASREIIQKAITASCTSTSSPTSTSSHPTSTSSTATPPTSSTNAGPTRTR